MFSFKKMKGRSGSRDHDDLCLTSISEEGFSYTTDESFEEEAKKKRISLFKRRLKTTESEAKTPEKPHVLADEESDNEDEMPLCTADDFGFIIGDDGKARFDYEGFQDDFAYIADTLFPGFTSLNSYIDDKKKKQVQASNMNGAANSARSKDRRYVSEIVEFDVDSSQHDGLDFNSELSPVLEFVRTVSSFSGPKMKSVGEMKIAERQPQRKEIASKKVGGTRLQTTSNKIDRHSDVDEKYRTSSSEIYHKQASRIKHALGFARVLDRKKSSEDKSIDNFKENNKHSRRTSRAIKMSRRGANELGSIENRPSKEAKRGKRLMRAMPNARFAAKKDWDDVSFPNDKPQKNELKSILKMRSDSQSVSSTRSARDKYHVRSTGDRSNKWRYFSESASIESNGSHASSVFISHVDGDRVIRSRVAFKQGLK